MIQILDFEKSYQNELVLKVPQLQIPEGVSWFQGVNGSGKSTFFKAISGILPFRGEVLLHDGISLKRQAVAYRKRVNYCPAEPLYPDFIRGRDVFDFHRKVYKDKAEWLQPLIDALQVGDFIDKTIRTYSSGMAKKLGLILACIGQPEVLILDEPLTTIDTDSQEILLRFLAQWEGTVLISSHHHIRSTIFQVDHIFEVKDQSIVRKL
ncbi:ATP-binding cassette domain-containing protein [Marinilongibacter aquaticus]|uniref:ABC transporter ATP-binding protein n=1 Tax=Marinilongibacter aquaticus TaxID=2975157 RepID=UPI0021BDED99|nr:ATP-binding cassette domain-containing protein [Marinilongibacter aquaticus]UBM59625.1 ATP-binding cassette domain-containing protein [Marinilongibacter aquaticus]